MFQALIILIQMLFASGGNGDVPAQSIRQQLAGGDYHDASVTYSSTSNEVFVQTPDGNIIVIDPGEAN